MSEERWLPVTIKGFEHAYMISDHGRVRSVARMATQTRKCKNGEFAKYPVKEKILSLGKHPFGYWIAALNCDGVQHMERVHQLVAQAFVPNPLNLPMVNHLDCDPGNNHWTNLEWCDAAHNINYATKLGRMKKKLTWETVALVRSQYANGETLQVIADRFGVSKTNVHLIVRNKIWVMPTV